MPDPNKIEGGRWDRVLRSIFSLKGAGPTAARLSDDISPTFNFPWKLEDEYLIGDRLMWARGVSVGAAGTNPRIILTNGSDNHLIIVERIMFDATGGGFAYIGAQSVPTPFIADKATFVRDGRWNPLEIDTGSGVGRFQDGDLIGAPTPILQSFTTAQAARPFDINLVLQPNDHFFLTNATINTTLIATFYWREHLLEPSESA